MIKIVRRDYVIIIIIRNYCRYIRMHVTTLLSESCNPATRPCPFENTKAATTQLVRFYTTDTEVEWCNTRKNISLIILTRQNLNKNKYKNIFSVNFHE